MDGTAKTVKCCSICPGQEAEVSHTAGQRPVDEVLILLLNVAGPDHVDPSHEPGPWLPAAGNIYPDDACPGAPFVSPELSDALCLAKLRVGVVVTVVKYA